MDSVDYTTSSSSETSIYAARLHLRHLIVNAIRLGEGLNDAHFSINGSRILINESENTMKSTGVCTFAQSTSKTEAFEGDAKSHCCSGDMKCQGNTLLHLAVLLNISDCVVKLLAAGAKMSLRNSDGCTPMDLAMELGNQQMLHILKRRREFMIRLSAFAVPMTDRIPESQVYDANASRISVDTTATVTREGRVKSASESEDDQPKRTRDNHLFEIKSSEVASTLLQDPQLLPFPINIDVFEDYVDWPQSTHRAHLKHFLEKLRIEEKNMLSHIHALERERSMIEERKTLLHNLLRDEEHSLSLRVWDLVHGERQCRRDLERASKRVALLKQSLVNAHEACHWVGLIPISPFRGYQMLKLWHTSHVEITGATISIRTSGFDESLYADVNDDTDTITMEKALWFSPKSRKKRKTVACGTPQEHSNTMHSQENSRSSNSDMQDTNSRVLAEASASKSVGYLRSNTTRMESLEISDSSVNVAKSCKTRIQNSRVRSADGERDLMPRRNSMDSLNKLSDSLLPFPGVMKGFRRGRDNFVARCIGPQRDIEMDEIVALELRLLNSSFRPSIKKEDCSLVGVYYSKDIEFVQNSRKHQRICTNDEGHNIEVAYAKNEMNHKTNDSSDLSKCECIWLKLPNNASAALNRIGRNRCSNASELTAWPLVNIFNAHASPYLESDRQTEASFVDSYNFSSHYHQHGVEDSLLLSLESALEGDDILTVERFMSIIKDCTDGLRIFKSAQGVVVPFRTDQPNDTVQFPPTLSHSVTNMAEDAQRFSLHSKDEENQQECGFDLLSDDAEPLSSVNKTGEEIDLNVASTFLPSGASPLPCTPSLISAGWLLDRREEDAVGIQKNESTHITEHLDNLKVNTACTGIECGANLANSDTAKLSPNSLTTKLAELRHFNQPELMDLIDGSLSSSGEDLPGAMPVSSPKGSPINRQRQSPSIHLLKHALRSPKSSPEKQKKTFPFFPESKSPQLSKNKGAETKEELTSHSQSLTESPSSSGEIMLEDTGCTEALLAAANCEIKPTNANTSNFESTIDLAEGIKTNTCTFAEFDGAKSATSEMKSETVSDDYARTQRFSSASSNDATSSELMKVLQNGTPVGISKMLIAARTHRSKKEKRLIKLITLREKLLERIHHLQSLRAVVDQPPATPAYTIISSKIPSVNAALVIVNEFREWLLQLPMGSKFEQRVEQDQEILCLLKQLLKSTRSYLSKDYSELLPSVLIIDQTDSVKNPFEVAATDDIDPVTCSSHKEVVTSPLQKRGLPPMLAIFEKQYYQVLQFLEDLWSYELECFESLQRLTITNLMHADALRRFKSLDDVQKQSLIQPSQDELYDIEI